MRTVAATPELVPFLMARLVPDDLAALRAIGGASVIEMLIGKSTLTWCGLDDGGVVTMGGVMPAGPADTGYMWQMITPAVRHHKRAYLRQGRDMEAQMLRHFAQLRTIIKADQHKALRHAHRHGWRVNDPTDFGGTLACLCERTR